MNVLFLILILFAQMDEPPKPPKLKLFVFINEHNQNEVFLKQSFSKKWIERINPKIREGLPKSAINFFNDLDAKTSLLKEEIEFIFVDRDQIFGSEFGFTVSGRNRRFYKFTAVESEVAEAGHWLTLFEYVLNDWKYPIIHQKWRKEISEARSAYHIKDYSLRWEFVEKKLKEKVDAGEEGWYITQAAWLCHSTEKETMYYPAEKLGYIPLLEPNWEPEPKKPVNPFPKNLNFSEKLSDDLPVLHDEDEE